MTATPSRDQSQIPLTAGWTGCSVANRTEVKRIEKEARRCLVSWETDPVSRTVTLKQLAALLVDLRSLYTRNGMPDWSGRSFEYRAQVSWIMNSAGLLDEDRAKIIGLLRYHVGNELRERVPEEELLAAGLKAASPKQRVLDSKGTYKSVDTAVKRLLEAVESLVAAPPQEITEEHLEAIGDSAYELDSLWKQRARD